MLFNTKNTNHVKGFDWIDEDIWLANSIPEFVSGLQYYPYHPGTLNSEVMDASQFQKLARIIGPVLDSSLFPGVRRIEVNPKSTLSLAQTDRPHRPHMDGTFVERPPSLFLLHFARVDPSGGGVSELWRKSELLGSMPPEVLTTFATCKARYSRGGANGTHEEYTGPLLCYADDGAPYFPWRFDDFVKPELLQGVQNQWDAAIDWVNDYFQRFKPISYSAKQGQTLLIPNLYYLHGRTALGKNSSRLVFRIWNR